MPQTPKHLASDKTISPFGNPSAPLWIVGEAPGAQELIAKRPFVGAGGQKLEALLSLYEVGPYYLTTLCPYRPNNNDFSKLFKDKKQKELHDELKLGVGKLYSDILLHKPKVILALGYFAMKFLTQARGTITAHRGSVYECVVDKDILVICSLNPVYVAIDPKNYPAFDADIYKASRVIKGEYQFPTHDIILDPSDADVDDYLKQPILAVDIESVKGLPIILCISFSKSRDHALVFDMSDFNNHAKVRALLDSSANKLFHFGSFDVSVLEYNGYRVNNYTDDTILAAHVLYPELPRDLGFLTSIHTDMPYYKDEGKSTIPGDTKGWNKKRDLQGLMTYNGKDTCATFWVWEELIALIDENQHFRRIYDYEVRLAKATIKMGHLGLLRDENLRGEMEVSVLKSIEEQEEILKLTLGGVKINPNSPMQVKEVIYKHFKLPVKTKRVKGKTSVTADNDALQALASYTDSKTDTRSIIAQTFISALIRLRTYNKLLSSQITVTPSKDGRIKSIYKVAGTKSGRLSAGKYIDGTGMNSQTITRSGIELWEEDEEE